MSYTVVTPSQTTWSKGVSYPIHSLRTEAEPSPMKSSLVLSYASAKSVRKKIFLTIFDRFIIEANAMTDAVHFVYRHQLLNNLHSYANLIDKDFPKAKLYLSPYRDEDYISIFITIYPRVTYKNINERYDRVLNKVTKSNDYNHLIDIGYHQTQG